MKKKTTLIINFYFVKYKIIYPIIIYVKYYYFYFKINYLQLHCQA